MTAIAAGMIHSLALIYNNLLMAWGNNSYAQLGNSTFTDSYLPVQVGGYGYQVQAISTTHHHSMALLSNNMVAVWGYNYYGQLGDGTTTSATWPVTMIQTW